MSHSHKNIGTVCKKVYEWVEKCINGRASEVDKTHSGHLKSSANRRSSVSLFTKMFALRYGSVYSIIFVSIKY
jgi:hypothetical protein